MSVVSYIGDKLTNLVANLGTSRDKASATSYVDRIIDDGQLHAAYSNSWLPQKIVDIPALDACRNWRDWQADSDQINLIEAEEKRLGVRGAVLSALKKARLWGGAAVYISTGESPDLPLNPNSVGRGGIKHLTVLTRRQLTAKDIDINPESPTYGKPSGYIVASNTGMVDIHPSRLVILKGREHPDDELVTGPNMGWGESVLKSVWETVLQGSATAVNVASLVFEAKIDVISIPELMNRLQDKEYERKLIERFSLAAVAKGNNGMLLLDAQETYEQKTQQFSGLKDIILTFLQLVSGAADIPMTRLLGQSPGGLNASGDNDTRNYYDSVRAEQELVMQPAMAILDECLIRSALGARPPEVWYAWSSLWQTTEKERADIGKTTADTIKTIADTGLIPDEALAKAAVSMLAERQVFPGLEAAVNEFGEATPEEDGAIVGGDDVSD